MWEFLEIFNKYESFICWPNIYIIDSWTDIMSPQALEACFLDPTAIQPVQHNEFISESKKSRVTHSVMDLNSLEKIYAPKSHSVKSLDQIRTR
jgi:hypothetical protein